jgi:hypothetical protein
VELREGRCERICDFIYFCEGQTIEEWQCQRALCDSFCNREIGMARSGSMCVGRLQMDGRKVTGASDALALQGLHDLVSISDGNAIREADDVDEPADGA